jgi:hypothetical protein
MSHRRGVSLVELMFTLSACTVILTMSAGLIHRAMHAQSKARLFCDVERSALRLAESFHRDVHAARSVLTGDEAGGHEAFLRLELAGGEMVEYRQATGRVERLSLVDGAARAREAFIFPAETRLTAEVESTRLVVLSTVVANDAEEQTVYPLPSYTITVSFRAEAVLGRNASLADAPENPR